MQLSSILSPLLTFLAVFCTGLILRKAIFKALIKWAKGTRFQLDDIIVESIKGPFLIWCFMLGIYIALKVSDLPEHLVVLLGKFLLVLTIGSVTLVASSIASKLIKLHAGHSESAIRATSLTQNITKITIFSCGILVILSTLGISITPILTALGVGGLAVALALQDTLTNLFAGIHIAISRQVRVGDYIRLESSHEGYVQDINWRSTKIRMLSNNVVIIPNSKLTQAIVTNFNLPDKELSMAIEVNVHYGSDLEKVERVTLEVIRDVIKEVGGAVSDFEPFIRFQSFVDSGIKFLVILKAKEFTAQDTIRHEFVKRLHKRYKEENIVIPYPVCAINYSQEKAA